MPTGYTDKIAKGIAFEAFVMHCARAFGACIEMRDQSSEVPIPKEFKVSTLYKEQLETHAKELETLNDMSIEATSRKAIKEFNDAVKRDTSYIKKKKILKEKYFSMLQKVNAWNPPTSEHDELKKFMIEQIESSIDFDCSTKFTEDNMPTCSKTGKQWLKDRIESAERSIAYDTKYYEEEKERVEGRNKWVSDLRASLE